jgi:hypothetical protein
MKFSSGPAAVTAVSRKVEMPARQGQRFVIGSLHRLDSPCPRFDLVRIAMGRRGNEVDPKEHNHGMPIVGQD